MRGLVTVSTAIGVDTSSDLQLPTCYKGVEIDFDPPSRDKYVTDDELRHGLEQLQFALLAIVIDYLNTTITALSIGAGSPPLFVLPVLVTNAPLYLATPEFAESEIRTVTDISQIAAEVSAVAFDLVIGPNLKREFSRLFKHDSVEAMALFKALDARKREVDPRYKRSAALEYQILRIVSDLAMTRYFSRIVLCNEASFVKLMDESEALLAEKLRAATEIQAPDT